MVETINFITFYIYIPKFFRIILLLSLLLNTDNIFLSKKQKHMQ